MSDPNRKIGVAICTPMPIVSGPEGLRLEPITVQWHRARKNLGCPTNWNYIEFQIDGMEVGEARCEAVRLSLKHDPRPEFLFFLDYDVLVPWDALQKLVYRARCHPDYDIYSGVYCCKGPNPEPLIYKGDGEGAFWDWALGDLLLEGVTCGAMGLSLLRTSTLARLAELCPDEPLFLTDHGSSKVAGGLLTQSHGSEDLYFCSLARKKLGNLKILVDTSVLAGHIQNATGRIYGLPEDSPPIKRAKWFKKDEPKDEPLLLKALDLGAGGTRREWLGYQTFTTDLRADTKPDYVMDTRLLNLHDESFDLVASSHHLEHIPRWEQEQVWAEMFRVLKSGGRMEHIVPNLEWAAWHIANGSADGSVMDVLYGAQEEQGYARELNTHYFGFWPEIAKALAEQCGLVDVEVKTYKQDESLGYNMILTGRKPSLDSKEETSDG